MSEELEYVCHRCRHTFKGVNNGVFVTGVINGVYCSARCLGAVTEAYLENVERAMLAAFQEVEKGGSG